MTLFSPVKKTSDVFGISTEVKVDSYVDRGKLDAEISKHLSRDNHIALRGESKCGKSWLRKKTIPGAIVVQCRLDYDVSKLYTDILSQLGIQIVQTSNEKSTTGRSFTASGEGGVGILTKVAASLGFSHTTENSETKLTLGNNVDDLRFICEVIKASGRRLVIEDFHYLSVEQRKHLSFEMKTMWDYATYIVVVGVWSQSNMLIHLNPDLAGRIEEISIYWSDNDLKEILVRGGKALGVEFSTAVSNQLVTDSFSNAGILQKLALNTLDEAGIEEESPFPRVIEEPECAKSAGMKYADQLNPAYQQFAKRVSAGIRSRKDTTGIYAHAMAVIMEASDLDLMRGIGLNDIFDRAHARQPRIQKGNLRTVLEKFEDLQVDDAGRGLVLCYNGATDEVSIVDRQLLLYRKYSTVKWPWEDIIKESPLES